MFPNKSGAPRISEAPNVESRGLNQYFHYNLSAKLAFRKSPIFGNSREGVVTCQ